MTRSGKQCTTGMITYFLPGTKTILKIIIKLTEVQAGPKLLVNQV
jgi:hypothetical protein